MKRSNLTLLASGVVALLTACGGGGSDTPTDNLAKYVGTWQSACSTLFDVTDATTSQSAKGMLAFTFSKSSATELKVVTKFTVYASTDTECAGTSLGVIQGGAAAGSWSLGASGISADGNVGIFTYDGQTTVSGKTVEKFQTQFSRLTAALPANGTATAGSGNRFTIDLADFQALTDKTITYINGNTLTFGGASSAGSYPVTLDGGVLTKQ